MNVLDIMSPQVIAISANDTLDAAIALMKANSIRHLPVTDADGTLIGVLSDRDCERALQSPFFKSDEPVTVSVRDIMTPTPVRVDPQTTVEEAAHIMIERRIHCLPVLRDHTLVGIVTATDLLRVLVARTTS